jgi:hypothetical protein
MEKFFDNIMIKLTRKSARKEPVFVLQMGRVGSTSVAMSVNKAYKDLSLNVPVYHSHYISNYEKIMERAYRDLANPELTRHDIYELDNKIREILLSHIDKAQPVKIISLVRDPVARN